MKIIYYGQHSRSEDLIRKTRDFDRQRITKEELLEAQKKEHEEFVKLQHWLPYISPGLFDWDDLIRPFGELIEGSKSGTLTRFFESNTFWRLLELNGPFKMQEDQIHDWVVKHYQPDKRPVFTLPFLFLFNDFSKGLSLENISQLLKAVAKEISRYEHGILIFYEPTFGWRKISDEEKLLGYQLLDEIQADCQFPIAIVQNFFSIENDIDYILDLPVDGVGIDFYNNTVQNTLKEFPSDKFLLAGILNTDSPLPESQEQLTTFFTEVDKYVPKGNVFVTTSGPAEFLPRKVIDNKSSQLARNLS